MTPQSLWRSISSFFNGHAKAGGAAGAGGTVPPRQSNPADVPVSFGFKIAWIAVPSSDRLAVAQSLKLRNVRECSWEDGIQHAQELAGVFVSPPVDGWTLAVGAIPEVGEKAFLKNLEELSDLFGRAFYFGTHRVVEYQAWAIAEKGNIRRAFAYLGEQGEFPLNVGERMPEEIEISAGTVDLDNPPDEDTVLKLGAMWVLDPRELDQHTNAAGPGLFGKRSN